MLIQVSTSTNAQTTRTTHRQERTNIYFLKYYYEEEPAKIISTRAIGRMVTPDGTFCLVDYDVNDTSKITYRSCFNASGIPTSYGSDKETTKVLENGIRLNFKGRDTTFLINIKEKLQNTTQLWFWIYMPHVNETVIVGGIRKNFITNTIDQVNTSYTYLGKEKLTILGKTKRFYKVKSIPQNGSEDVHDERWFDKKGMLVKERHVVGKDGVRVAELSKIVRR